MDLGWAAIALGLSCAALVVVDIFGRGYRQRMQIMEAVWPITALYFGPLALWGYLRLGRPRSVRSSVPIGGAQPAWHGGSLSASHCGAGCVLGDIVGAWVVFGAALTIAGLALYPDYLLELGFAWMFGIAFQYLSIKPARPQMPARVALLDAVKADTLSIVAFEVGMFAWMALSAKVLFHPAPEADSPVYWFMMQIGLMLGFATTYPVNRWLVRIGIKSGM